MPRYNIVAGFDFGTSFSKIVLQEQNTRQAVVVTFNGYADGLLDSLVGFDGTNLLPPSAKSLGQPIAYLKMLAAHVATGTALAQAPVRVPPAILARANGDGIDLVRELLAFYFSHVIAGVQQFIRSKSPWKDFNFDVGNNEDYLVFQLAVPTGLLSSDGKTEKLFREAFIIGHELSIHADPMLVQPTPISNWSERVKAVQQITPEEINSRYKWQCLIYPEVAAAVQTILRSNNARDGLYITMDVGAGTVDINAFQRNTGQHLGTQNVAGHDRRLNYYAASVEPLGVHNLSDPYDAVQTMDRQELIAKVRQAIWILFHRALVFQHNHGHQRGHRTWDHAIILQFGGGAVLPTYQLAFRDGLTDAGIQNPEIRKLPDPKIDLPPESDSGRFAVAFGMSFAKYNLDQVRLPDELKTYNELFPTPVVNSITPPEIAAGICQSEGCGRLALPGENCCYLHM
jgi:hypothetical protein